jgi:hypothetical protein
LEAAVRNGLPQFGQLNEMVLMMSSGAHLSNISARNRRDSMVEVVGTSFYSGAKEVSLRPSGGGGGATL